MLKTVTNEAKLEFIKQENNNIFFSSSKPLNRGELIVVNNITTAIVKEYKNNFYIACVYKNIKAETLRVKNWWSPSQGQTILLADKQFFIGDEPGLLEVFTEVPDNYYAGNIGWTLNVDSKEQKVNGTLIVGSDWRTPTLCTYKVPGYWPSGVYTLYATRFNAYGYSKVSSASISWTVTSSISSLKSDVPLNLY